MSEKEIVSPETLCDPVDDYGQPWSHGVFPAGEPLYISGQTPVDGDGDVVHHGDLERQFRRVLENVEAVLMAAGGSTSDLTALTIYLTDMETWHEEAVSEVRYEFLTEPYPCSTLIEIDQLVHEEMLVEASAIAHVDRS